METKLYSDIFPSKAESSSFVDAEVIVIGAGIAGASIAHHCATSDPTCRVIVVEQYNFSKSNQESVTKDSPQVPNHGSSRGGPRRIGVIGGDSRVLKAWKLWIAMDKSSKEHNLMDIAGEVYIFSLFPFGWMFMVVFGVYFVHQKIFNCIPNGFQFLWTAKSIERKLGTAQGFRKGCWSGCVGISYKDSATLHTDQILNHLLDVDQQHENLQIRYGSEVSHIQMDETDDNNTTVKVTLKAVHSTTTEQCLRCKHLVIASGGWTGDILRGFLQDKEDDSKFSVSNIQTSIEVFTCPVYKIMHDKSVPSPFSLASGCPLFSCVSKKVYGFPVNQPQQHGGNNKDCFLYIRPFFKAFNSDDPNDQRISNEQKEHIDNFVKESVVVNKNDECTLSYSHCYTCRYPKLSLDNGKSFKPVFDFVPCSNQRIVVHAGLDGYCFKLGSVYGMEFMELLDTGTTPKNCQWPKPGEENKSKDSIFMKLFRNLAKKEEEANVIISKCKDT